MESKTVSQEHPSVSEVNPSGNPASRQQNRYWALFYQLTAQTRYVQLRFERRERISWWLDVILAIASSASVSAWLVWEQHRTLWATIAAGSQVVNLVRKFLPNEHNVKALREGSAAFKLLLIECEAKLHGVLDGILSDQETCDIIEQLQKRQHEIEEKMFAGMSDITDKKSWSFAEAHAAQYTKTYYGK